MAYLITIELLFGAMLIRFLYMGLKEWNNQLLRPLSIWGFVISLVTMVGLALAAL